jgi:transcription antitermination factor NusG
MTPDRKVNSLKASTCVLVKTVLSYMMGAAMSNVAEMAEVCSQHSYFENAHDSQIISGEPGVERRVAWFALVIHQFKREQCEQMLAQMDYEVFSPCIGVVRQWSDRKKLLQVPLFPGYIFCRLDPEKKLPVLKIPGVLSIVGSCRRFLEVDAKEIEAIRVAIASRLPMEPIQGIAPGQKVKVTRGPLCGLEGRLMRTKTQSRLLLSVSMLNRHVSVEMEANQLTVQN